MGNEGKPEVRLAPETIEYLRDQMREAVSDGIRASMTKEVAQEFWGVGIEMLKQQAKVKTGGVVLEWLGSGVKKVIFIALVVGAIYMVGGLSALKAAWKFATT